MNIQRMQQVSTILIIGTLSAVIFHYSKFAFIGDHSLQFSTFFHHPISIFCDFNLIYSDYIIKGYGGGHNYFPGLLVLLDIIHVFAGGDPYVAREIYIASYLVLTALYIYRSLNGVNFTLKLQTTFIWIFCNYAILFTLHTGNIEGFCFLLVAYAVALRIKRYYIFPCVLLAFAASIKMLPALFIFVILNKSNKLKCLLSFSASFLFFLSIPFAISGDFVGSFIAWYHGAQEGMRFYQDFMMISTKGIIFGHSLINAIRLIIGIDFNISGLLPYYSVIAAPVVIFVMYQVTRAPRMYMKVLMVTCVFCLIPVTSTDYKLQYFLIPLLLLCKSKRKNVREAWICAFIALLLVPKGYVYFYNNMYFNINTIINAGLLLLLLTVSLRFSRQVPVDTKLKNELLLGAC